MAVAEKVGIRLKLGCIALLLAFASGAPCLHAATYYVTIAGLGGTPEYETQFQKWATDIDRELRQSGPDVDVQTIYGPAATRERIESVLRDVATKATADDAFALFLIGHGSFDGSDYKFNIPGPDITAGELASALNRIRAGRQLVVNMSSCSGASLAAFAKRDRIVITATKSGSENNATVFARYWVDALRDPAADTDKNGDISALEAFRYTQSKTNAYFESEKLLATEHAVFTDTGSTNAVRDPKPDNHQGLLASAFLVKEAPSGESAAIAADPQKAKLLKDKQQLEAKIDRLKYQKAAMPEQEYRQELTALLLQLARTQAEIDK